MSTEGGGCVALIVAAGRGTRFGTRTDAPKQYMPLAGAPVLRRAVEAFVAVPGVADVRVVIHGDDHAHYEAAVAGLEVLSPVTGGATRRDSVRHGLESLIDLRPGKVLIHDAARPLVDHALIGRVIDALDTCDGAVPALAVADSLKLGTGGVITGTMPRENVYRVQTPQGFRFEAILDAHKRAAREAGHDFTDDAAVAEFAGLEVALVAGAEENLKITTDDDLARAAALLAAGAEYRTGQGFDIHAFDPAKPGPVRLCGIDVPADQGLKGHSDADAGLHALTDAILGAVTAGDIGEHFPPSDSKWKDADSAVFLGRAVELAAEAGGHIVHLDVTVICETPKVSAHRNAMRARIAEIVGIDAARVSVKATTMERLGAIGRGEGLAAQAVATVALPAIANGSHLRHKGS